MHLNSHIRLFFFFFFFPFFDTRRLFLANPLLRRGPKRWKLPFSTTRPLLSLPPPNRQHFLCHLSFSLSLFLSLSLLYFWIPSQVSFVYYSTAHFILSSFLGAMYLGTRVFLFWFLTERGGGLVLWSIPEEIPFYLPPHRKRLLFLFFLSLEYCIFPS